MRIGLSLKLFFHKLFNWEYWPTWIIYLPCFIVYPYYAIRSRSTMFFTVANPAIKYSGAFLSSKTEIYSKLNNDLIPKTYLITDNSNLEECQNFIRESSLSYPLIVKPDYGLKGLGIKIITTEDSLIDFLNTNDKPYLLQEFVDYNNELGVFVIRQKDTGFKITSIVTREFMTLIGNGRSTVEELILANPRYAMQFDWLSRQSYIDKNSVLSDNEKFELIKIGNHSKGTIFRDANNLNTQELLSVINKSIGDISGFNYGRLDIKYKSLNELFNYNNFKIIELNGVFSEPAHIYDPDANLIDAWKVLIQHFRYLFAISLDSIKNGHRPVKMKVGVGKLFQHFRITSNLYKLNSNTNKE